MSGLVPQYRMEVRAPISVDPTEATLLIPAAPASGAGATHTDPFMITTMRGLGDVMVSDAFNRVGNLVVSDTPGMRWVQLIGTWSTDGALAIASNSGNASAGITTTVSDGIVEADLVAGSTIPHFVLFRATDAVNGWVAGIQGSETAVRIYKQVSGGFTEVGVIGGVSVGTHTGRLKVVLRGTLIAVYFNGVLVQQVTDAQWQTATIHGLFGQQGQFDNFSVTGLWKPYMGDMRGRRGRIDLKSRSVDAGNLAVDIIDKKTIPGQNLNRWWTAFFGDGKGNPRGKLKVVIDESLDNGATWNRFWAGRLQKTQKKSKTAFTINLRDEIESLKMSVFTGAPHSSITYAGLPTTLPIGIQGSGYGLIPVSEVLTGSTGNVATVSGAAQLTGTMRKITLDKTSQNRKDNIATKTLYESVAPSSVTVTKGSPVPVTIPNFSGSCRARIKHLSGANNGSTGVYKVGQLDAVGLAFVAPGIGNVGKKAIGSFAITTIDAGMPGFLALPAVGVNIEVTLFIDAPISSSYPIYVNDVDPATFLTDLCAGKFGYFYGVNDALPPGKALGDPRKTVALNSLSALVGTRAVQRYIIKGRDAFVNWVEKNVLKQNNWAWYIDRNGALTVVDLALPTTLAGLVTLTDTDVEAGDYDWDHDTDNVITRVEFDRYVDIGLQADSIVPQNAFMPALPLAGVEEHDFPLFVENIGSLDFGDGVEKIDASGYRAMDGEQLQGQSRFIYLENKLIELAQSLRRPYGWGLVTIQLPCGRTANVTGLTPGALCLMNVSFIPDPYQNRRNGTRLVRVLEMSEDGPRVNVTFCDMGLNVFAAAPTLGTPAQDSTNVYGGITVALTLNASNQPAEVAYAAVAIGGAQPATTDPVWSSIGLFATSQTITIGNLPPNSRIWVRARTHPIFRHEPMLLSPWVVAGTAPETSALPAPSAPSATLVGGKSVRINWTYGASELATDIGLATPTSDPPTFIAQALPTASYWDLSDLTPNTTYRVTLRHRYGQFVSAVVTVDFTTGATSTTAPAIVSIRVVR